MRMTLVAIGILLLTCSGGVAGERYEDCRQEEKRLRTHEAESCSGFTKMVNPSGCITAQKALKEYDSGKCRKIGEQEGVGGRANAKPATSSNQVNVKAIPEQHKPVAATGQTELEKLQIENSLLKAEIARLKAEIDRLKNRDK